MPTDTRQQDRIDLARAVLSGSPAISDILASPGSMSAVIELELTTSDVHRAVAVLEALLLSFETAAVVTEYIARGGRTYDIDETVLANLASSELVNITLLDLHSGSIWARFSIDPRTQNGRKRLLTLVSVGLGISALLLPPLVIPATVVGIVGGLNDVVTPDELRSVDLNAARDVPGTITPAPLPAGVIRDEVRQAISDEVARQVAANRTAEIQEDLSKRAPKLRIPASRDPDAEGTPMPEPGTTGDPKAGPT